MPKRISLVNHLSSEELEQGYRQAKEGVESRQDQIIKLLTQGKTTEEVQEITGYSRTWIYALVKRYNELGIEGLGGLAERVPSAAPKRQSRCRAIGK